MAEHPPVSVYLCDVHFRSRCTYQDAYIVPTARSATPVQAETVQPTDRADTPASHTSSLRPRAILASPWMRSTDTSSCAEGDEPTVQPFEFQRVPLAWHCHGCTSSGSELLWWDDMARPVLDVGAPTYSRSATRSRQKREMWRRAQQVSPQCAHCLLCPRCGGGGVVCTGHVGSRHTMGSTPPHSGDRGGSKTYNDHNSRTNTRRNSSDSNDNSRRDGVNNCRLERSVSSAQCGTLAWDRAGFVPGLFTNALSVRLTRSMACYVVCDWCQWKSSHSFADMNELTAYTRTWFQSCFASTRRQPMHVRRAQRALAAAVHGTTSAESGRSSQMSQQYHSYDSTNDIRNRGNSMCHDSMSAVPIANNLSAYHRFVADVFADYYRSSDRTLRAASGQRGSATHPAVVLEELRQRHLVGGYVARYLFPPVASFPVYVHAVKAGDYRARLHEHHRAVQKSSALSLHKAEQGDKEHCAQSEEVKCQPCSHRSDAENGTSNDLAGPNSSPSARTPSSCFSPHVLCVDEAFLVARSQAVQCGNETALCPNDEKVTPNARASPTAVSALDAALAAPMVDCHALYYRLHPVEKECVTSLALQWQSPAERVFVLLDRDYEEEEDAAVGRRTHNEPSAQHAVGSTTKDDSTSKSDDVTAAASAPHKTDSSDSSDNDATVDRTVRAWALKRRVTVRVLSAQLSAVRCVPWLQCQRTGSGNGATLTLQMINLGSSDIILQRVELKCQCGAQYSLRCGDGADSNSTDHMAQDSHGSNPTSKSNSSIGATTSSSITQVTDDAVNEMIDAKHRTCDAKVGVTQLLCNTRLTPRCTRKQLVAAGLAIPHRSTNAALQPQQDIESGVEATDAVSLWSCVVTKSSQPDRANTNAIKGTSFFGLRIDVLTRLPVVQSLLSQGRRLDRRGAMRGPLAEPLVMPDEASYRYHAVSFGAIVTW